MISHTDVAWLAGLLEGEGCFSLNRGKVPMIEVGMTDEDVVRRCLDITGFGTIVGPYTSRGARKLHWRWRVRRQEQVEALLKMILPHMGQRRSARIMELLAYFALPCSVVFDGD